MKISLKNIIKSLITSLLAISVAVIAQPTNRSFMPQGYKLTNQLTYSETLCGGSIALSRQLIGIKSLKPIESEENTFYRFTLGLENFESIADQQKRLDELNNPETGNSLFSKSCNLIAFFSCNNRIYFVHTDSLLFSSELDRIRNLYQGEACVESKS